MRGADSYNEALFSTVKLDEFVPPSHPLRPIRTWMNDALAKMDARFSAMYESDVKGGRPSIAPEKLMRAMLLQVLYSIRSERQEANLKLAAQMRVQDEVVEIARIRFLECALTRLWPRPYSAHRALCLRHGYHCRSRACAQHALLVCVQVVSVCPLRQRKVPFESGLSLAHRGRFLFACGKVH